MTLVGERDLRLSIAKELELPNHIMLRKKKPFFVSFLQIRRYQDLCPCTGGESLVPGLLPSMALG